MYTYAYVFVLVYLCVSLCASVRVCLTNLCRHFVICFSRTLWPGCFCIVIHIIRTLSTLCSSQPAPQGYPTPTPSRPPTPLSRRLCYCYC